MHSTVDEKNKIKILEQVCRAQFDYDALGEQELSFKAGEVIKIFYKEDDTWLCREFNGEKGMFPKDFVELMNHWLVLYNGTAQSMHSLTTGCILEKYEVGETWLY